MNVKRPVLAVLCAWAPFAPALAHAAEFDFAYKASILNVVELGEAAIRGQVGPETYAASASVRTSGAAAIFDDTRISASAVGRLAGGALGWSRYELSHAYARKHRRIAMRRTGAGVTASIVPNYRDWGDPPATDAHKAASHDPVTALVALSRSVAASGACRGQVSVFDGRGHYTLTLGAKTRGTYKGGGYDGAALVCTLTYRPVSGFKAMSAQERARIPVGEMWFGAARAGLAPPLRIEVPTPVGALRIDLERLRIA